jgi:hypothetical protein
MGQILELALAALVADGAIESVVDEHQLHQFLADGLDAFRIGHHLLALGHVGGAGRQGPGRTGFHFHHADAAGADGLQSRVVAHIGDKDAVFFGNFQDGFAFFRLYGPAVDGQINHKSFLLLATIRFCDVPELAVVSFSFCRVGLPTIYFRRAVPALPLITENRKLKTENRL